MNCSSNPNNINIFLGNFDCEEYWSDSTFFKFPCVDFRHIKSLLQHLGELFIFCADSTDILILREKPDKNYIDYLKLLGVTIPQIITLENNNDRIPLTDLVINDSTMIKSLRNFVMSNRDRGKETFLVPYGTTIKESILSDKILAKGITNYHLSSLYNNKMYLKQLLTELNIPTPEWIICNGIDDFYLKGLDFINKHKHVITKEIYGSGGSGLRRFDSTDQFKYEMSYIQTRVVDSGMIVMEKWYESKCSYNYQYIASDNTVFPYICSQQIIDRNGRIIGSFFDLNKTNIIFELHKNYGHKMAKKIVKNGYRGVIGFDSIVCENEKIFPIIDINCRINLSTIFFQIINKYFKTQYAIFFYKEYEIDKPIEFEKLIKRLGASAYSSDTQEGVVILNYATLNRNIVTIGGKVGRIFYGIFSNKKERIKGLYDSVFKSIGVYDEFVEEDI